MALVVADVTEPQLLLQRSAVDLQSVERTSMRQKTLF